MRRNLFKRTLYSLLKNIFVPILSGRLKNKLWSLGCGKIFRFLTTTYEKPLTELFNQCVRNGDVVYDIGAHIGYFTLLFSVLVDNSGKVYAFEPNKDNLVLLKKHVEINKCMNVVVIEKAVTDKTGSCFFSIGDGSWTGKILHKGECKGIRGYFVETIDLDSFVFKEKNKVPNIIKIDVEGEELKVLIGGRQLLSQYHPTIFLSVHSEQLYKDCVNYLSSIGYKIGSIKGLKDLIIARI